VKTLSLQYFFYNFAEVKSSFHQADHVFVNITCSYDLRTLFKVQVMHWGHSHEVTHMNSEAIFYLYLLVSGHQNKKRCRYFLVRACTVSSPSFVSEGQTEKQK